MPNYKITAPDGTAYNVTAPEGATEQDALKKVQQHHAEKVGVPSYRETEAAAEGGILGGIPIIGPAIKGGAERIAAGLKSITPGGKSYSEELKGVQGLSGRLAKEHPVAETLGEITGGVLSTGAVGATATGAKLLGLTGNSLGQIMLKSAASGAVIGGADAAVRGDNPELAGALGGVVGGVAPGVGRLASIPISRAASALEAWKDPAASALKRVAGFVSKDRAAGNQGLSAAELAGAQRAGQPVTVMEQGGTGTRALARSAADTSREGRGLLEKKINQRFETQTDRLVNWARRTFNFPNAEAQRTALDQVGRTTNSAAYKQAYREGAGGIQLSNELMSSEAIVKAMKAAQSVAKDEAVASGYGGMNTRITVTDDGRIVFNKGPAGVPTYPDLQFWDLTRRQLSDAAKAKPGTDEARRLKILAHRMNAELDAKVPSYAKARASAAQFFGAENALEAGEAAVTSKHNNEEMRAGLAKMSPLEKQLFQDGYVSKFISTLNEMSDRAAVGRHLAEAPAARERLAIALGPQRAAELETLVHVENVMDFARTAVSGNSMTSRYLAELGLAGGVNAYEGGGKFSTDPEAIAKAALVWGAARGHGVVNERLAAEVARLLASSRFADVERAIAAIAKNPQMVGSLRQFDAAVAAIAARSAAPPISRVLEGGGGAAGASLNGAAQALQ